MRCRTPIGLQPFSRQLAKMFLLQFSRGSTTSHSHLIQSPSKRQSRRLKAWITNKLHHTGAVSDAPEMILVRTALLLLTGMLGVTVLAIGAEDSPITSPVVSTDQSPAAVTAADRRGWATAGKDIKRGIL